MSEVDAPGGGAGGPCAGPVLEACRRATSRDGAALLGLQTSAEGVRVRLSSWRAQDQAVRALRELGYRVLEDVDAAAEQGDWFVVSGWDGDALRGGADRLKWLAEELEGDLGAWAQHALDMYREEADERGADEDTACGWVIARIGREIRELLAAHVGMRADVDDEDRSHVQGEVRELLDEVAARELVVRWLRRDVLGVAGSVIGLYREFCEAPASSAVTAAAQALLEVGEGTRETYAVAVDQVQSRAEGALNRNEAP